MPFVQLVKEKMETVGLSALNLTLDFNEFNVLEINKEYLKNTLGVSKHHIIFFSLLSLLLYIYYIFIYYQLQDIVIKYTDEAPEKTREECCPGAPYMTFSAKPMVPIHIINPQSCSSLFEVSMKISTATVADIVSHIVKQSIHIKGK